MKSVYKAGQNYTVWKAQNSPEHKPWLYPIQSELPMMDPAELSIQHGDSLENVDETSTRDAVENEDSSWRTAKCDEEMDTWLLNFQFVM